MTGTGRNRILRRLLMTVMVLVCLAVATVYVGYRHFRHDPRVWVQAVPRQFLMSMDEVHHTATRDGRTEWELDARRARLDNSGDAALHLTKPAVRFYPREGGMMNLRAETGLLYTASSNIEVQDRVVLHNDSYRLETDRLRYDHALRRLLAPTPVNISSRKNTISAATMTVYIDQRRAELVGDVKGVFSGPMLW